MDMKKVMSDCRWLVAEAEELCWELEEQCKSGEITELEANRKMRWFLFQTANRILSDSVDRNMPLPNWRNSEH